MDYIRTGALAIVGLTQLPAQVLAEATAGTEVELVAIFLVLADWVARMVLAPSELPLGVVTALIGAPFFINLLRRTKREYTF